MMENEPPVSESEQKLRMQYHELAQLSGSLAHEIKNPLSVIRMNMDLLAEDLEEAETPRERRVRNKIDVVHRQCLRLENILNDFLKFARLRQLDLKPGSLNRQIETVLDLFEPQARENQVDVLRYFDEDLPMILLDAETLQAALVNLVKNALEAMPDGGQLLARTRITRNGVALDLIDDGEGIEDSVALNMFSAFYSTKDGGTGLGLPTARKIIEAHGGRIGVQSQVGAGTQFTLEFATPHRLAGKRPTGEMPL
ncbi:sensor histidine kinase [Lignipirellula cremea]|uniref:histidine kinase n=1 Tax=Lignipirellula cremea TaxID=2528010 RepID=A0A518DMB3_9BACT|nr:ATP-binding protein [Lignipirellula cremea]QDU92979.1 Sporulation kinase A [Lignipirellula cremea]